MVSQNNHAAPAARRQAQQVARAQTRLARDIATLSRHSSALDNDTSLGDVIQAMKNELAAAQGDLAAERQKACNDGKAGATPAPSTATWALFKAASPCCRQTLSLMT